MCFRLNSRAFDSNRGFIAKALIEIKTYINEELILIDQTLPPPLVRVVSLNALDTWRVYERFLTCSN